MQITKNRLSQIILEEAAKMDESQPDQIEEGIFDLFKGKSKDPQTVELWTNVFKTFYRDAIAPLATRLRTLEVEHATIMGKLEKMVSASPAPGAGAAVTKDITDTVLGGDPLTLQEKDDD